MILKYLILLLMVFELLSCNPKKEISVEVKAIMEIQNNQRKAHFEKNIAFFTQNSNTDDFIEVNRGTIKKPTPTENAARFKNYFNSVDFIKWDDITPPIISFSDDGSMATVVVDKLVIVKEISTNKIDSVKYAWLAVYKKQNGHWLMHRMGSSNN